MKSLYWKICGTFLLVVLISQFAGFRVYRLAWNKLRSRLTKMPVAMTTDGPAKKDSRHNRYSRWRKNYMRAVGTLLVREAVRLKATESGLLGLPEAIRDTLGPRASISAVYIREDGRPTKELTGREAAALQTFAVSMSRPTTAEHIVMEPTGSFCLASLGPSQGWLLIGPTESSAMDRYLSDIRDDVRLSFVAAMAAVLLVAVVLGLIVFRVIASRFSQLAACMTSVGSGDLSSRVADLGSDEIGDLGRAFNSMADRLQSVVGKLEASSEVRRQFLADVSHELRTPLTSVRANLESMLESAPEKATQELTLSLEEIDHIAGLVDDLLEMARMDTPQFKLELEECVLQRLVADCLSRLRHAVANRRVNVVTRFSPEPVRMAVDKRRLLQAVSNLLTNAIRSIDEGGTIEVTVEEDERGGRIQVADDGPGIPPEQLASVFERFRSGTRGGTGLGLSIVRRLVQAHGGSVELRPRDGRGLVAEIRLPGARVDTPAAGAI